ncbi:hypothetical protein CSIM01_10205 [Colletotrichum simmondsii]|uniref:Uncharacterized protein n=1 Tax=Colletotrichum simmondsii TaxID=703756 RepID=A0A135SHR4_9PEZI|nr:hypothetical protein CSIM01_10205 [Colletotrichum simmondsii]
MAQVRYYIAVLHNLVKFTQFFLHILLRPQTFWDRITKAAKTADSFSSSHWVRLDEPGRYIGIWDDVGSSSSQTDVRKPFALQKIVEDDDVDNAQLKSLLRDIPPQVDGVARVFLQEVFDDDIGETEPASGEGFPYEFSSLRSATGSFLSLITNQPYGRQSRWYFLESFTIEESQLGNLGVTWVNSKRFLRFQAIDNRL